MNSVTTVTLHPHLREEEVLVVENAIRLAIDSIINVLYGVNSARTNEFQRILGDRDKEIQRLNCRLRELEHEHHAPRQPVCTCRVLQKADCSRFILSQVSADQQPAQLSRYDPSSSDPDPKQECEDSNTATLFERPSLQISLQSNESSVQLSPSRRGLRQSGTPHSTESFSMSDAAVNVPTSPSSSAVKEEPCEIDKVFIQWEISQQESERHQEDGDTQETPTETQLLDPRDRRNIRNKAHAPPDGHPFPQRQHLRMKKKSVPMSELSEEAQRLKRAAWRAASRRYYARKIARQQANSARLGTFSQVKDFRSSQVERRTLMQELPNDRQMLQRAAPTTYCTSNITHHQAEPTQAGHLPQDAEWLEGPLETNGRGSHDISGGIMCS
ncbi:hypothetical protein fugu_009628 [Takifugu bimaculatus]|uniref:Uncharacterized protein n=1 Tax=Takifugu bimaculatus TaxID=433685 RepID=A0A4Z2CDC0_9TELE|nr:hypothetical protein fugu_009628 [Takifugu bimaculatus]